LTENQCEFTLTHYRAIIRDALANSFQILRLCDADLVKPGKKQIVLRHDIDFSVESALRLATVEHELGVAATYCVLLHSPTYNVGEADTIGLVREIQRLGHEIALHYDLRFFEDLDVSPAEGIRREAEHLGFLLGAPIMSVAQHLPATHGQFDGVGDKFIDAYAPRLTADIQYISDSRGRWRAGCVHEHLPTTNTMQLLIHPEWWVADSHMSQREKISSVVELRQKQIARAMADYLTRVSD
jgi:hypothetical protein